MLGLIMYNNDTFNCLPYLLKHITDLAADENPVILVKIEAKWFIFESFPPDFYKQEQLEYYQY